ncbi:hypothetical protein [Thioclava sp. FTW29]|uniref:Uncharacterized protein n=1 Tax=Thioclava litoralis TaxID=3076557 RepID=A0ABZ1E673_9RHOB|nr:hypothetical protein RPE78_17435 [Thioclava sp. FTW29]
MKALTVLTAVATGIGLMTAAPVFADMPDGRTTGAQTERSAITSRFQRSFGHAGLLTIWSSNEIFGITQDKINNGMLHFNQAENSGVLSGYRDNISTAEVPISALVGISDHAMVYTNLSLNGFSASPDLAYASGGIGTLTVEYLNMPSDNLTWGIGAIAQYAHTNLKQNDGKINNPWGGIRGDLLYKMNDHWALANRFVAQWGNARSEIPLGFATLTDRQHTALTYWQSDLVGTYSDAEIGFLPAGWLMHPRLGFAIEELTNSSSINSLGTKVDKQKIHYSEGMATLRFEKPVYGPGAWSPQLEFGLKHEFVNSFDSYSNEQNFYYSSVGLGRQIGKDLFFNLAYVRYDGFRGNVRNQTFKAIFSYTF